MGCSASRPAFDDLPGPQIDPHPHLHYGRGISVPAVPPQTSLLHGLDIVPLSANTYGISLQPGELPPRKMFAMVSGPAGSPPRGLAEADSMADMLQMLESLDMGIGDSGSTQTKLLEGRKSSILEDLKPGLERHFNQALGKPLQAAPPSMPLSGKENAMPAGASPQREVVDRSAAQKGSASPGHGIKASKGSASPGAAGRSPKPKSGGFASRFLKRSSSSAHGKKHGDEAVKAIADDDSSGHATLQSGKGPNGSLLFDEEFLASYESALKELTPEDWNLSKDQANLMQQQDESSAKQVVAETPAKPQQVPRKKVDPLEKFDKLSPPGGENSVVLYTTSLRGIRKTFEDCNSLRGLLESFQVRVDERDVAMHQGFRSELREMMGNNPVSVPCLFIKGRYIGGAEDVLQLHEEEQFAPLLEGLPQSRHGPANLCDGCGGARFVPCLECSGGRKVVDPDNPREVIRCPDCNENGLIQCPICS